MRLYNVRKPNKHSMLSQAHTGLETIGAGAGQHLVDAQHVEGVDAHAHVERVLAAVLGDVLVAANARSLKGLGGLCWEWAVWCKPMSDTVAIICRNAGRATSGGAGEYQSALESCTAL